MGLYLCVMDPDTDEEFDGFEVGTYTYFNVIRDTVINRLGRKLKSKLSLFLDHPDSDGQWRTEDLVPLRAEIALIRSALEVLPTALLLTEDWYLGAFAKVKRSNLYDCVVTVDAEPFFDRLDRLCDVGITQGKPILFQ